MTSGSARTLCDMTQPKRELPKSPFFCKWLHIPHGLENSEAGFMENLLYISTKSERYRYVLHLLKL